MHPALFLFLCEVPFLVFLHVTEVLTYKHCKWDYGSAAETSFFLSFVFRLNVIFSKFDEVQRSGNMVLSAGE